MVVIGGQSRQAGRKGRTEEKKRREREGEEPTGAGGEQMWAGPTAWAARAERRGKHLAVCGGRQAGGRALCRAW